ncbi:MAG TPA: tRNA (guanosine(37)-N1)-methyltransferase TrmD, partial [Pseudogracilibacillus sp.]|nr:tRNA (guanosine(37)-N1)-methyltransferase TrmD [Pseudogracilibacillus sp.]
LIIICGHYEGYDERIRESLVTDEISIGDYVLTSGEIGALTVVDSVVRLLPNVLGNKESSKKDSFSTGLLEHPHYTRPREFKGMKVPEVLLQGNHAKIELWRMKESLRRTYERRPELINEADLNEQQKRLLKEIKNS